MKICRSCHQVLPQTDAERQAADIKTIAARQMIDDAQSLWEAYSFKHPVVRSFWARNPELGAFISFFVAIAVFGYFVIVIPLSTPLQFSIELVLYMIISIVAAGTSLHFLVIRTRKKPDMHEKAVRNAFVLRYKAQAECLEFATYRN